MSNYFMNCPGEVIAAKFIRDIDLENYEHVELTSECVKVENIEDADEIGFKQTEKRHYPQVVDSTALKWTLGDYDSQSNIFYSEKEDKVFAADFEHVGKMNLEENTSAISDAFKAFTRCYAGKAEYEPFKEEVKQESKEFADRFWEVHDSRESARDKYLDVIETIGTESKDTKPPKVIVSNIIDNLEFLSNNK